MPSLMQIFNVMGEKTHPNSEHNQLPNYSWNEDYIWRKLSEAMKFKSTVQTLKNGGGSIMQEDYF